MKNLAFKTVTSVTRTVSGKITRDNLIDFICSKLPKDQLPISNAGINISFRVPSGGDWSGCDLELDNDEYVIEFNFENVSEEDSE